MDLKDLYRDVILDHNKQPAQFRPARAGRRAAPHGHNPLCGDRLTDLRCGSTATRSRTLRFEGQGCAISVASASLMTEAVKGKTRAEVAPAVRRGARRC